MTRLRLAFPRALLLVPLAGVLLALLSTSSLRILVPVPLGWLAAALGLALAPALLARGSPLPHALLVLVAVLAAASYDQSRLDWLRVLKDYGVASPGAPDPLRMALALAAFGLAWALHVVDGSLRLRWSAASRGIPDAQARAAVRVVRARSGTVFAGAALGTVAVGGIALAASVLDVAVLLGGRASLLAPLLAVGLVALAATLLWRERA